MNIKDLVGFSKPLEKFIDVCASVIGKEVEPRRIRKRADAKAYEMKVITEALLDSKKKLGCNTSYKNGEIKFSVDKSETNRAEVIEDNTLSQIVTAQTKVVEEDTSSNEIEMFNNDMERRIHYKNLKIEI